MLVYQRVSWILAMFPATGGPCWVRAQWPRSSRAVAAWPWRSNVSASVSWVRKCCQTGGHLRIQNAGNIKWIHL